MPGSVIVNQPGVYLVDADGNVVTLPDGVAIGSAEAILIAGKDGSTARIIRVAADGTVRTDPTGTTTQPISVTSLPLPTGAATEATLALIKAKTDNLDVALSTRAVTGLTDAQLRATAVPVSDGGASLTVDDGGGSITVDGPLTDAQLRASAVPVSATSLPLPAGAATQITLAALLTELQLKADLAETQPVSAASLPLPTGAATAALQTQPGVDIGDVTVNNAAGAAAVNIQDGGNSITVDATSLPLPTGAATEATLALIKAKTDNLDVALSTRAVTGLTDAELRATSVDVLGPLTDTELRASAVPVSAASLPLPTGAATAALQTQPGVDIGDVTVNNAAGAAAVNIQDGGNSITVDGPLTDVELRATAVPVSVASIPLPTGAATESTLLTRATEAKLEAVRVILASLDGKDFSTQTSLAALLTAFNAEDFATQTTLAALLTAFNAEDFATQTTLAALLSAFSSEDFATETTLLTRLSKADFEARINTLGQKAMAASTPVVIASDQSVIPVSDNGGSLTVDGTVGVSGTVAISAVSLPLPTGASTAALQTQPGVDIGDVTVNNAAGAAAVNIQDGGNSITVDSPQLPAALVGGRLDENVGAWLGSTTPTVGQKTMANSLPVVMASDQSPITVKQTASTATLSDVASSATSVTILAANVNRLGAIIVNDSNKTLYIKFSTTASLTSYTEKLLADASYEVPFGYTGIIDGIWASANGNARVTELT